MKGCIFTLFLFSVLLAVSEVRSEESLKLCGKDFIRAIIYICGASRWRRDLEESLQGQLEEQTNHFRFPGEQDVLEEGAAQNLGKLESAVESFRRGGLLPTGGVWGSRKHPVKSRRDLSLLCCTEGCSMADLSSFC
ncbi:PREDICTED: insulin-like peptide INSL5 [Elephantulus edwardii]|uniref:insulin-like peptide INSL5 n=1 Tax=Elephantulus edwardii TaxID=28737 RepID=UPI0003F0BD07|nr:PREDICTED: insulin-like peptide INSL5 [Elephantulus edwardii]